MGLAGTPKDEKSSRDSKMYYPRTRLLSSRGIDARGVVPWGGRIQARIRPFLGSSDKTKLFLTETPQIAEFTVRISVYVYAKSINDEIRRKLILLPSPNVKCVGDIVIRSGGIISPPWICTKYGIKINETISHFIAL